MANFIFYGAFMFDAPGSMNVFTIALATSFFLYPVPIILGNVLFWVNKKKADIKKLVTYTILSSSGPVFVVLFFMLLELACNGKFSCN